MESTEEGCVSTLFSETVCVCVCEGGTGGGWREGWGIQHGGVCMCMCEGV